METSYSSYSNLFETSNLSVNIHIMVGVIEYYASIAFGKLNKLRSGTAAPLKINLFNLRLLHRQMVTHLHNMNKE
jgi:hypothetical protein